MHGANIKISIKVSDKILKILMKLVGPFYIMHCVERKPLL